MSGDRARRRVLFIGLDAADEALIEQWCREGHLPNLERLRARGIWSSMRTTADVLHVSAWPSIFCGTPPDQHGLYHAYVMEPGRQAPVRPRPERCPVPFFWKLLDEAGRRCIVMDAFLTCPLQDFSGVQIVDWGSWTHFTPTAVLPPSLEREMRKRFGAYPAEDHSRVGMIPPPDPSGFRERLLHAVRMKTDVLTWLMESRDWDLLLAVFGECHAAGHYFWHYHDPSYPAHPAQCDPRLTTALRDVYRALDEAIGVLLGAAGSDTIAIVASGDGMGPNYSGSHILPDLLGRMGLMNAPLAGPARAQGLHARAAEGRIETPAANFPDRANAGDAMASSGECSAASVPPARGSVLGRLRRAVPPQLRAAISRHVLPKWLNEKLSLHWKTADIRWDLTRAFAIDNANEGYIRINLRGREPHGVVEPGAEYEALRDDLVRIACQLINPANGRRAALAVHAADALYDGQCRATMPDVIINWDPQALIDTRLAGEGFTAQSSAPAYAISPYYTGNHLPHAFMAAAGPGLVPGADLGDVSVLDLAPTVLALLDVPPPAYMSGRVLLQSAC